MTDTLPTRLDVGLLQCGWCWSEAVVTVSFEDCPHMTAACDQCFDEYFLGIGLEWLYEPAEFPVSCPECTG
jgi:hypothetical protein